MLGKLKTNLRQKARVQLRPEFYIPDDWDLHSQASFPFLNGREVRAQGIDELSV
jgi:hypothetical protein